MLRIHYNDNQGRMAAVGVELNRLAGEFFNLSHSRHRGKDYPADYRAVFERIRQEVKELKHELYHAGEGEWKEGED